MDHGCIEIGLDLPFCERIASDWISANEKRRNDQHIPLPDDLSLNGSRSFWIELVKPRRLLGLLGLLGFTDWFRLGNDFSATCKHGR